MNHILLTFATFFICSLFCGQVLAADSDIHCRAALYLGGTLVKTNTMKKDSKYVTPEKPLEVLKSDSYLQQNGFYYFKAGYYLYITAEKDLLSTMTFYNAISYGATQDAILQIKPKPDDKNVIGYSKGMWMIAIHHNVGLKEGENNITLKLDSNNVIKESDEQNNIYKFKVTLKP